MRLSETNGRTLSLLGILFLEFALWVLIGGVAMLWWLPGQLGQTAFSPFQGALFLAMMWGWVFNQWPRVGTRRFFRETRFLKIKVALLIAISLVSAYGFISAD